MHDSVVLPVRPVNVRLASGRASITKTLRVRVRNADPTSDRSGYTIQLAARSDCPGGTVGEPDFGAGTNTVAVGGGRTKTARVPLTITSGSFTNFNHKVAQRCTITLTASALVSGNTDPTASNNVTTVELNVIDKTNAENTAAPPPHETFLNSIAPVSVSMRNGEAVVKRVRFRVGNGDYRPTADQDIVRITRDDGTCPAGTVTAGALDTDTRTAGDQDTVQVDGGRTRTGFVQLTIDSTQFTDTPNAKAPERCTAMLSAVGPSDPDPDPTNNSTQLVIDVIDR